MSPRSLPFNRGRRPAKRRLDPTGKNFKKVKTQNLTDAARRLIKVRRPNWRWHIKQPAPLLGNATVRVAEVKSTEARTRKLRVQVNRRHCVNNPLIRRLSSAGNRSMRTRGLLIVADAH